MVLGDPLEQDLLSGIDVLVHAAALVQDTGPRAQFERVNVTGTELLARTGVPMVLISSASVYAGGAIPRVETDLPERQESLYGRSKRAAEIAALRHGAVVLRPRAVYGPGDPHLLPRVFAGVRRKILPVPGPDVPMSMTSIELLVAAVLNALHAPAGTVRNVSDDVVYSRDRVLSAVLETHLPGSRLLRVPILAARAAGMLAEPTRYPLSRYAVEQLVAPVVLDTSGLRGSGLAPEVLVGNLAEYLGTDADLGFTRC
jgi:nucleoside-diphosphate-sugar epimerase